MKNLTLKFIVLVLLSGCMKHENNTVIINNRQYIEKQTSLTLNNFNQLKFTGATVAHVGKGDFSITVKGDSTDLLNLVSVVTDNKLWINVKPTNSQIFGLKIEIIMPEITNIEVLEASNVTVQNFNNETFKSTVSGASKILAYDMTSKNVNLNVSGASEARINVTNELVTDINGASRVYYRGAPLTISSHIAGASALIKD